MDDHRRRFSKHFRRLSLPYASDSFLGELPMSQDDNAFVHTSLCVQTWIYEHSDEAERLTWTAMAGSDVVQSGSPIFDDFVQHLWPYIGNNTANVVFQMVKRLWLIRINQ
ncbi:hypothetical protein TNCV_1349001 [Trichonephila clavipes]|nr:hypothetical protein TNCV_1349001 [Trichonephila clavipes]